jgi:hypothetical protein
MRTRTTLRLGAVIIAVAAGVFALTGSAGGSIAPIPISDSIAFMSTVDGEADIYTMNPVSLAHDNLTHDDTVGLRADMEPAWSPPATSSLSSGSSSRRELPWGPNSSSSPRRGRRSAL